MKRILLAAAMAIGLVAPAAAGITPVEEIDLAGDYAKALSMLIPAARHGDPGAQYLLGVMCRHGQGVERSAVEAEKLYFKAARQGFGLAEFSLGFMYVHGAGDGDDVVAPDPSRAFPWLVRAAAAGVPVAQALVGEMFARGDGVDRNLVAGAYWTMKAAERGVARAQCNAAMMYARAEGVQRDMIAAHAWITVLADRGYPGASQNRDLCMTMMTAEQLDASWRRVETLRAAE